MTFPAGSHLGNAPTPVVNHDHQIPGFVPDIPQIFPMFYSLKLMSPTLSTPKRKHIAIITIHHIIPYFSPTGWSSTLFSLYFSGRSKTARNHHFFHQSDKFPRKPAWRVPAASTLGWRVWIAQGVMGQWWSHELGGGHEMSWKLQRFFHVEKKHLGMVKWTSMKPFSWGIYKNPLGITKATFIGID